MKAGPEAGSGDTEKRLDRKCWPRLTQIWFGLVWFGREQEKKAMSDRLSESPPAPRGSGLGSETPGKPLHGSSSYST